MSTSRSYCRSAVPGHKQRQPTTMRQAQVDNLSPRTVIGRPSGTADHIRARYLQSLNIPTLGPSSVDSSSATKMAHTVPQTSARSLSDKIRHEALKGDYGQVDEELMSLASTDSSTLSTSSSLRTTTSAANFPTSPIPSHRSLSSLSSPSSDDQDDSTSSPPGQRRQGISFDATVTVKSIPTRNAYSDRIRCHLWASPEEMHRNAQRNAVEFASEHCDWHLAVEDADMFVNIQTGEKVHPVHIQRCRQALEAKKKLSSTSNSSSRDHFLNQSRTKSSRNSAASKVRWSQLYL